MKRHFSNRGEAISEVAAARFLAKRKVSLRASFMTQAERRINSQFWPLQLKKAPHRSSKKQVTQEKDETILL